ncbi:MAG: radical SAM protein [Clostridia bacterium]|nr:radical SAM protein [Clostridia bacterium]
MYYSLKSDCYYRKYGNIGYIIRPIVSIEEVVDNVGSLFVEKLSYEPRDIDEIVGELYNRFDGVDILELKKDVMSFFSKLAEDGFLNYGDDLSEYNNAGFDYSTLKGKLALKESNAHSEESSSKFLVEYFKNSPYLTTFHIELTSKCNERCVHCYIPHEKKDTDISSTLMYDVLKQCKDMGVLTVIFSGGEPMLHPDFCNYLHYAKDLDLNVTVLSNLTLLNKQIIKELSYKHASCVNVSLYSMQPDIHDKITGISGSFEITKNNILKLIDNNIPVQINCPVMKQNKSSFYDVIRWGQDHKCAVITDYLIMARYDGSVDNLKNRLSEEDLNDVINKLIEYDVIIQSNILQKDKTTNSVNPDDRVCGVGMTTLCMIANGMVYPCAGWQKYICGDLNKNSLKEIWKNSPQVNFLRQLRQRDFKQCVNCEDAEYCLMCMGRNSNEASDGSIFYIPEITCSAAKINRKVINKYIEEEVGGNVDYEAH